ARYPGFGTHRGYKRAEQRVVSFMGSDRSNAYVPGGDEVLKARIREGSNLDKGTVPPETGVYITPGVAGALRLLCDALIFPPIPSIPDSEIAGLESSLKARSESGTIPTPEEFRHVFELINEYRSLLTSSNVVIPLWTYPSHLAEVFRAHGEVRTCCITDDGQIDLKSLADQINEQTKAIIFATVGNPLCTAMEPERFDKIIGIVRKKMDELGRPIIVVADTIYEHFRRDPGTRIDPVKRAANLDLGVPIVDTSSFSKMMVLAGARVGYLRHYWPKDSFPDHRHDFLRALELIYWPTLCPVATQVQLSLAELYMSINRQSPVEEELAPMAAMLAALKALTDTGGTQVKNFLFSIDDVREKMRAAGVGEGYFLSSIVAGQTRKIANKQLQGYAVDIDHEKMEELISNAQGSGLLSTEANPVIAIPRKATTLGSGLLSTEVKGGNLYVKLERPDLIPPISTNENGQLNLYGISNNSAWREVAKMCGIRTETDAYENHKRYIRDLSHKRTDYAANQLMSVPGIRLHPALVGADGTPLFERMNSFYLLWGFEGMLKHNPDMMQAARIANLCIANRQPVISMIPGELFLIPELRPTQPSYVRQVTLTTKDTTDRIMDALEAISPEAHW
ncbi:MAG: aminotransferase class I/II-fold pyridoxal phosphate-dependent enzyme, partial [Candidatus Micrarchaeota archaeon]